MGKYVMIERELMVGSWHVTFLFANNGYEDELVLTRLYDIDAPIYIMQEVNRLMDSCEANCGFTYTNGHMREAVVLIGPTTSGEEFIDTLVHEVHHLAVAVAYSVGVDLESETPAYISGDSARELADVVCHFGCSRCN